MPYSFAQYTPIYYHAHLMYSAPHINNDRGGVLLLPTPLNYGILKLQGEVAIMAMPAWLPEAWNRLSADNQKQASDYLQYLLSQQEKDEQSKLKKRKLGLLANRFVFMADDFNEPLAEFKEYM